MKRNNQMSLFMSGILLCYLCMGIAAGKTGVPVRWLFWNLFLAVIPFYTSLVTLFFLKIKYIRWIMVPFLLAIWLLFLPNSFYMLTDLIHLNGSHLILDLSAGLYSSDLSQWIQILYIAAGILLGIFFGIYSTVIIYLNILSQKCPRFISGCAVLIISFLVGYGVYIGRFLRVNTWDILHPRTLAKILIADFNLFALKFSGILAFLFLSCFTVLLLLIEKPYIKASKKSS